MSASPPSASRIQIDGKFFRLGEVKFFPKGVTYGPFPPNSLGEPFPAPAQASDDFERIRELGANLIRIYDVPPHWLLELATRHSLHLMVDVPWNQQACFLESPADCRAARQAVSEAVRRCGGHAAVFAFCVANEIPADIVRWSGAAAVADFLDDLVATAKAADPGCLCTYGNFPSTEYLQPRAVDFVCFNVYLHQATAFKNHLARLQMLADTKPLLLGEFGMDSRREGEASQAEFLGWQIELAFRGGLAGTIAYSFTDEWFKDGRLVTDWGFGLTTRERVPKPAFAAVQRAYAIAPYYPLPRAPMVSVVVAGYNAERTLRPCLEALGRLHYPHYEVLFVDDGSTDRSPAIAAEFPAVQRLPHPRNLGLSAARNTGIGAARGEIVAFTDADCRPDEDWLLHLVGTLVGSWFAGVGGHNLLPPDDSTVAAAVLVSPGGPAHVMLDDRVAEHIPGCNMAFWKWALAEIGGFDPVFRLAGDDVDVCWRLQRHGHQLGFSPAGFVWHYRRSTLRDYLRQQHGYGEAEAQLERKHPEYFNPLGSSMWRGRIYAPHAGLVTRRPMIYHGFFGTSGFQSLYTPSPSFALMLLTSLEYYVLVVLPLLVLATVVRELLPVGLSALGVSLGICVLAAVQAPLLRAKQRWWSRPLVALLFALQPIVRGWARYQGRLRWRQPPLAVRETLDSIARAQRGEIRDEVRYWAPADVHRHQLLTRLLARLDAEGWPYRADTGWQAFDLEIYGSRWCKLQVVTVSEYTASGDHVLRCRLHPAWPLPARLSLAALSAASLLLIGLLGRGCPWRWWVLLSLPLLVWWLHRQQRHLQRIVATLLDQLAEGCGLRILPEREERPPGRANVSADRSEA
jgi:GT2 family glycosyltransferase